MKGLQSSLNQYFNYKTLLLYVCVCSIILIRSYYDHDGRISPDSTFYLNLSKSLSAGEGFSIADYNSPDGKSFFAIWPVGYPIMIFIVSKFTGLGIFWASKVLNLFIVGVILLLFQFIFKKNSHWAGLILFVDSFILIFSFTWSEVPFILILILLSISLYKSVESNGNLFWLTGLFFSGIALFLIRYIGLFSVGIIGLIALIQLFRRNWFFSIKLLAIGFVQTVFAAIYLYHNKVSTGFTTGMERNLPKESNIELLNQLFAALKDEYIVIKCGIPIILTTGLLVLLGFYLLMIRKKDESRSKPNDLWKYFFLAGLLYFAAIVVTKWFSDFTPLDYRYLFPSSFMWLLSLASYLQGRPAMKIMNSTILYLAILITLTIHYIPQTNHLLHWVLGKSDFPSLPNYFKNTQEILEESKAVESKSIVIFGSFHLRYLKDYVIPTDIYGNYSLPDMINYFNQKGDWNVYVKIRNDLDPDLYHESFIRLMETNSDKQIIKVN